MKTVTSLPNEVIAEGELFVFRYKMSMRFYALPAFSYFLLPQSLSAMAIVLLGAFYLYVFFLSGITKLLWKFDRLLWCQLFISLAIGLGAIVFLRFFDLTHWLIHEVGYVPNGEVKQFYAAAAFIPLVAAYFDSFKKVELAFYKSKGFNYSGFLGDLSGL